MLQLKYCAQLREAPVTQADEPTVQFQGGAQEPDSQEYPAVMFAIFAT
jgi:hypothetical protein